MVSHPETGSDSPIGSDRDRGCDKMGMKYWKRKIPISYKEILITSN